MQIVFDRSEEKLAALLRQRGTHGCLHITGSIFPTKGFAGLPSLLIQWLGEQNEGTIYVCHDMDIFVMMPGITLQMFSDFRKQVVRNFPQAAGTDFVHFYDSVTAGRMLPDILNAKLARCAAESWAEEERLRRAEHEIKRERILSMPPDRILLSTLKSRRGARGKTRVLIVDDDSALCELLEAALHDHAEIVSCNDAETAVARHLEMAPDIVFLDIDLPDVNGQEVLEKMLETDPNVNVVMLSGKDTEENVRRASDAGASGFIGKPFAMNRLLDYIGQCRDIHNIPQLKGA